MTDSWQGCTPAETGESRRPETEDDDADQRRADKDEHPERARQQQQPGGQCRLAAQRIDDPARYGRRPLLGCHAAAPIFLVSVICAMVYPRSTLLRVSPLSAKERGWVRPYAERKSFQRVA